MKMIILDAGHGSGTPGKRSPKWEDGAPQLLEWAYNRRLVTAIADKLNRCGIANTILVPEEEDIPLRVRCQRANDISMRNGIARTLIVSVHCNAAQQPNTGTGWEVHTSPGKTKADEYAAFFLREAGRQLGKDFRIRGHYDSNFYILRHTASPALLTENLFYDNRRDYDFMMTTEGFNQLVNLHVDAIIEICKATVGL